uniref:P2Y purinoceptor 4-like n=1 Tax=Myxine glutinosa TaxID=7769 RepID=UPI00358E4D0F
MDVETMLPDITSLINTSDFNNETKCVFDERFKFILLPISYSIVSAFGMVLNLVALWIFVFHMRPWTTATLYMCNLSLCDLLYTFSLPLLAYYYASKNNWPFGEFLCKITRFMFYFNLYGSIMFLMCISVHRYLGVCHPMKSMRWSKIRNAKLVTTAVWLFVLSLLIPILVFTKTSVRNNNTLCHDTTKPKDFPKFVNYNWILFVLVFLVPFLTILVCDILMVRRLLDSSSTGVKRWTVAKKKSVKMLIIVLVVFSISFVPFHITRSMYYSYRLLKKDCATLNMINMAYKVTRPMASLNCCLDPILYFLVGDRFRKVIFQRRAMYEGRTNIVTVDTHNSSNFNRNKAQRLKNSKSKSTNDFEK